MSQRAKFVSVPMVAIAISLFAVGLFADQARDLLDRVIRQSFGENFRSVMIITTFQGSNVISSHVVWVIGQHQEDTISIFMDFEEPEEQKGLRYLFKMERGKEFKTFVYDPSVKKTATIDPEDRHASLGGTGLIMDDIGGTVARPGETEHILGKEKIQDRECTVVLLSTMAGKAVRRVWVDERHNLVVRTQTLDADGQVVREMSVVEFFRNDKGQEYPREMEIRIPGQNMRVRLHQSGLQGVEVPAEIMHPETFGDYKWLL